MSDSDLPGEGTADDAALSFDDGVDAIESLFGDPETDLPEEDQGQEDAAGEDPDAVGDDASDDGEDPDATDDEAPVGEDQPDGSGSQGRFVSKDAKFRLEDGTVISVGDLARNNLFQRDYTRKTEELKAERQTFDRERQQVDEVAQSILAQRDLVLQAAQYLLPEPDASMLDEKSPNYDPFGYSAAKHEYDRRMDVLRRLTSHQQAEQAKKQEEQKSTSEQTIKREFEALVGAAPEFKDPKFRERFRGEAVKVMGEHYGFTEDEIDNTTDHRFLLAMRDLAKMHRARSSAPKVSEDLRRKPVLQGGKRMDPKGKTTREASARKELLRKTGSFEAGVSALMDLDL